MTTPVTSEAGQGDAASPQSVFISFQAEINPSTSEALLSVVAQQMMQGKTDVHLLLSTLGGHVSCGIAAYNTLRGMPITLTTHNVGTVNSIGNVLYLAGERRFASPTSSFMFHGVGFDITTTTRFEEKHLRERMDQLTNDQSLIAEVICKRSNIDAEEANRLFLQAAFVRPDEAQAKGIVHEIRDLHVPPGAPVLQLVFQR
jgi:ATP-dependent Clp protease, protease subunit